ncbi:hypothetical protein M426DRAFT_14583 [Hypoxylon sp. CI-4A]|nr:hypothetical protein M426DRAFT_14583 [Hypoxylon sp. CI-4A]
MSRASGERSSTRRTDPLVPLDPTSYKRKLRSSSRQDQDSQAWKLQLKVGTAQREIFEWYETNEYKYDAGVIYSPEWKGRLVEWIEGFDDDSISVLREDVKSHEKNPEELEIGRIFQADPVAAFSLWNVLQSCYQLDKIICGTKVQNRPVIAEWHKRRPFQYLLSQDIVLSWEKNLHDLVSETESCTDLFQKEKIGNCIQYIMEAIHDLKEAVAIFTSVFEGRREDLDYAFWMLKMVQENVDNRWPQELVEDGSQQSP